MNKATKYGINGALAGGIGNGILNMVRQLNNNDGQSFDWLSLFKAIGRGALVVGGAGAVVGAAMDHMNKLETPIDTDAAILKRLGDIRLTKNDPDYRRLREKSDWLIEVIKKDFSGQLRHSPYRFGSTETGTALKENFDIDICASFRPGSFTSTEDMYLSVLGQLNSYVGTNDIIRIRDQKKSLGIFFSISGSEQKIDVLPHKLSLSRANRSSGYLHVNNKGLFEKSSRTKTDINLLNSIRLSDTQNKILLALKKWKSNEQLPISSHLLKYFVLDAYSCNKGFIPRKLTGKIIMALQYIQDNIEYSKVCSIENTNNVLTNMSGSNKAKVATACRDIIEQYEYQPNSIVKMIG